LRNDLGTGTMHPFVAAGVVKMAVSVDQVTKRLYCDCGQSLRNLSLRGGKTAIHRNRAIWPE
jgi:hypothetical protein